MIFFYDFFWHGPELTLHVHKNPRDIAQTKHAKLVENNSGFGGLLYVVFAYMAFNHARIGTFIQILLDVWQLFFP